MTGPIPSTEELWRLEHHWTLAPWLTVLLVAAVAALVAYCYAREASPAGAAYRAALAALRLTSIALVAGMLSELLLAGTRTGRPRLVVAVDASGSMTIADPQGAGSAPGGNDGGRPAPTRIEQARAWLADDDASGLKRLAQGFDLEVYRFGAGLQGGAVSADQLTDAVGALAADPAAPTRLGDAIQQALESGATPPQGLLVITDGQGTEGRGLASAAESARRAGTPLYLVGVGGAEGPPDLELADPLVDEAVLVDDLVVFQATLRRQGRVAGPVRVTLHDASSGALLASAEVDLGGGESEQVRLTHRPQTPGRLRYELRAPPLRGELNPDNNRLTGELEVLDQKLRVLLASGYPSYEYRYLKSLLERDSTVTLRTFLQEADPEYAASDRTALTEFPLRAADLGEHDAVVLLDLDPGLLPRSVWGGLRGFVVEGGGLLLGAGPRYLPWAYRGLADFEPVAPVLLATTPADGGVTGDPFTPRPTPLGAQSPALQIGDDPASSAAAWRGLAPQYWHADLGEPKPAARVLATHPSAVNASGKPAPLIVTHYLGAGQVTMHGMDSTYRWRFRVGDAYFARYWVQTLRGLARGRLRRDDRGWELTTDRRTYRAGEGVRLLLHAAGPDGVGRDSIGVVLSSDAAPERRVELLPDGARAGRFTARVEGLPPGAYRAVVAESAGDAATAAFDVVSRPGEFARLAMNRAEMQAAAARSGGWFRPLAEAGACCGQVPAGRPAAIEPLPPIELWNRWWVLATLCVSLVTEWVLRKRRAML